MRNALLKQLVDIDAATAFEMKQVSLSGQRSIGAYPR